MKTILTASSLALVLLLSTGCAPKGYAQSAVGQKMTVHPGVVQSVRQVVMENKGVGNVLGGIVGTVAGTVAGSKVGGGSGKVVATVLGGALGSVAGGMAGNEMDTDYGQEVIVKLNNGQTVASVLRINGQTQALQAGQAVNVFYSGGSIANISPL